MCLPAHVPPEEPLEAGFGEVGPACLEVVKAGTEVSRRWAYYLSRHHYLGLRVVGQNIGYEDRFSQATKTLDFYHGSQHLWSLAHHLYPESKEAAAAWVGPLLHQLRHTPEHRVINTLEKILADNPDDALICREVNYFQNHRDHLNYAGLAARDAPIGSGSMESVCSQFQDRLKHRGQFGSPRGLANLLVIDVAHKNNTLPFLWN